MSSHAAPRGALLLFEGIDRSGKSTQVNALIERLRDRHVRAVEPPSPARIPARQVDVSEMRFPDRTTPTGKLIHSYLLKEFQSEADVIHLLFVANRNEILAKLRAGTTVVMDRYSYSGAAFTAAKQVEGLDLSWCRSVEAGQMPAPDALFFMDLPIEAASLRGEYGKERYETQMMQQQVYRAFEELRKGEAWTVIDAQKQPDEISREILQQALEAVEACRRGRPLRMLWTSDHTETSHRTKK